MKEWFENWFDSPYYHLLYRNRDHQEAELFVDRIMQQFPMQPDQCLLDLACGKGRHALAFSKYGMDVTGLDLSPESIAAANQFAHEKLHFFVHDMRHLFRANYFDRVVNLFTSFGYFCSPHDNEKAAQSMAIAVKPGGQVLIDFINREPAVLHIQANRQESIEREGIQFSIERSFENHQFVKQIHVTDHEKTFHFEERVNSFSLTDMVTLFEDAGLQHTLSFGNYQLEPYYPQTSPRMILVFTKPHV